MGKIQSTSRFYTKPRLKKGLFSVMLPLNYRKSLSITDGRGKRNPVIEESVIHKHSFNSKLIQRGKKIFKLPFLRYISTFKQ